MAVMPIEINSESAANLIQSLTVARRLIGSIAGFRLCRYFFREAMAAREARYPNFSQLREL